MRVFDRYFFFAVVVSTVPILVLYNGLAGSHGNSVITGIFIVSSLAAVALFNQWRQFVPNLCDVAFVAYVGCIAVSFWLNGINDIKEAALLILTLAAYPAARLFAGTGLKSTFVFVTLAIVTVGAVVTGFELIRQWDNTYEKPILFGMFAAGGNFMISLGFAMIASTCLEMTPRQRILVGLLIVPATAIFAASMVRLAFMALLLSLALSAYFADLKRRLHIAALVVLVFGTASAGLVMRSDKTALLAGYAMTALQNLSGTAVASADAESAVLTPATDSAILPSCSLDINHDDTINIRVGLLRDALALVRTTGWFGIGLDGFMKRSCIAEHEVHDSFLQAAIEFGWFGGAALVALVGLAGLFLLPLARFDPEARFALCSLVCVTILTLGSGRTSDDGPLFLFLGFASGLHNLSSREPVETVS